MTHDAAPLRRRQIFFHSPPELVSIRRVDEAVVIGAALSLSSSAFVLKILQVYIVRLICTALEIGAPFKMAEATDPPTDRPTDRPADANVLFQRRRKTGAPFQDA